MHERVTALEITVKGWWCHSTLAGDQANKIKFGIRSGFPLKLGLCPTVTALRLCLLLTFVPQSRNGPHLCAVRSGPWPTGKRPGFGLVAHLLWLAAKVQATLFLFLVGAVGSVHQPNH